MRKRCHEHFYAKGACQPNLSGTDWQWCKYTVPRFQRDYAWNQEQWEDLQADIETLKDEHYHYMGYIVLQRKGTHTFEVIDGQQRLVTLSLIVLAAMRQIKQLVK